MLNKRGKSYGLDRGHELTNSFLGLTKTSPLFTIYSLLFYVVDYRASLWYMKAIQMRLHGFMTHISKVTFTFYKSGIMVKTFWGHKILCKELFEYKFFKWAYALFFCFPLWMNSCCWMNSFTLQLCWTIVLCFVNQRLECIYRMHFLCVTLFFTDFTLF